MKGSRNGSGTLLLIFSNIAPGDTFTYIFWYYPSSTGHSTFSLIHLFVEKIDPWAIAVALKVYN